MAYILYLIIELIIWFIISSIKFLFALRENRRFRKDFLKDLIFYRIFPHNFYETYTQINFNYIYYPVFYYQNLDYLYYSIKHDEYFDLLAELDTLEDSMEVFSIKRLVQKRLTTFQLDNFLLIGRYIFHYTNENLIYSFFLDKDHNIFKHFNRIQDKNDFMLKFNNLNKKDWKFTWKDYIEKDIYDYHENTFYYDNYKYDEEFLFSYFPAFISPVGKMENLYLPHLKEFLSTDYAILLKKDKDLKKLILNYKNYKLFMKNLSIFTRRLVSFFETKHIDILKTGHLTFTDSINANFHFSNFLFFTHIYLQTWENSEVEIEESPRYFYKLDFLNDRVYLLFFSLFYIFFLFFCYYFIFYNIFIFYLFFHLFFYLFCYSIFFFLILK